MDFPIYAGRPLIYGLLAAIDPVGHITSAIHSSLHSFTRAMHALRHPESDSEMGVNNRAAMTPDESVLSELDKEDFREHSQIMASTSTLGTPARYPSTQRGQIATSAANNQEVSLIDVVCHI
ncbi:hypothetical protein B0H13DRAFT_2392581 [Mycena leptocephala]|nr:hypothetical protein B0H13DRAFT_2392581 [Mycena leptocephala]